MSFFGRGSEQKQEKKAKEALNKSLFTAVQNGEVDNVKYLLDQGAEINARNAKNETPLLVATAQKHCEVVRTLLERGADFNVKNKKGKSATDLAKENNDQKTKYILSSVLGDKRIFDLLETMGLLEHWEKFLKEEIKYEDLEGYTDKDLEELGVPKGPRGRLLHHFHGGLGPTPAPALGKSDQGPRSATTIFRERPIGSRGASLSELPVPAGLLSKRPLADPARRSLPPPGADSALDAAYAATPTFVPEKSPSPKVTASDHYGVMPRLNGNSTRAASAPQLDHYYTTTPEFEPEHPEQKPAPGNGQYAAVSNGGGPEYADVVDESDYASQDPVGEYAAPPDLKPETPSKGQSDSEFDSTSYREINYSELVLEEEIGRGAFGSVYRGTWRGAPVAIKKLHSFSISDPHMVAEFRREASMMQLVGNHPNIVKFVGACSKEEPYCLVSLFCSNGSLESFLKKEKLAPVMQAKILMETAAGVLHLHCEGVIHRDLAARNVLVGDNYQVYITDFGFARIKEAGNTFNTTKSTIGPVKYMAPESLKDKKYSEKTDAFSFGVLLWEVLNPGKVPYEGEDLLKIAMAVITQGKRLPIPDNCHPTYKKLMQDCWQEDPEKRPNFQEIYKRLYDHYKELAAESKTPIVSPTPTPLHNNNTNNRGGGGLPPRGGLGAGRAAPGAGRGGMSPLVRPGVRPPGRPAGGPPVKPQPAPQEKPVEQQPQQPQQQPQQTQHQPQQPQQQPQEQTQQSTSDGFNIQFPAPGSPSLTPTNYASYVPSPTSYASYAPAPQPSYTPSAYTPAPYVPPAGTGYATYTPQPTYAPTPQPTYTPPPVDYHAYAPSGYASYQPSAYTATATTSYPPPPAHGGYASYDHSQPVTNYPPPADPYHGYASVPSQPPGYGYATVPNYNPH